MHGAAAERVEQAGPGNWSFPLPSACEIHLEDCVHFWTPKRHQLTGASSAEGHHDDQGWPSCRLRRGFRTETCSAQRRERDRVLTTVYSSLVGGDGEDIVGHGSAQRKDSKPQGDIRAGEIPPGHKRKIMFTIRMVKLCNRAPASLWDCS